MTSRQEKEMRAEAAAGQAAFDLKDINREREYEGVAKIETDIPQQPQQQEERPGLIGSVIKAVADTYEHAKEAVVGKSQETAEKTKETGKLGELKESAMNAARRAVDLLSGQKEDVKQKTSETAQTTKEKSSEAEEETRRKMEEMKIQSDANKEDANREAREGGVVRIPLEASRPGYVAATLKTADQVTGQTFNDARPIDEEGVIKLDPKEKELKG